MIVERGVGIGLTTETVSYEIGSSTVVDMMGSIMECVSSMITYE